MAPVDSVTISALSLISATSRPLISPTASAASSATPIASHMRSSWPPETPSSVVLVSEMIAGAERSMPRPISTSVCPMVGAGEERRERQDRQQRRRLDAVGQEEAPEQQQREQRDPDRRRSASGSASRRRSRRAAAPVSGRDLRFQADVGHGAPGLRLAGSGGDDSAGAGRGARRRAKVLRSRRSTSASPE